MGNVIFLHILSLPAEVFHLPFLMFYYYFLSLKSYVDVYFSYVLDRSSKDLKNDFENYYIDGLVNTTCNFHTLTSISDSILGPF